MGSNHHVSQFLPFLENKVTTEHKDVLYVSTHVAANLAEMEQIVHCIAASPHHEADHRESCYVIIGVSYILHTSLSRRTRSSSLGWIELHRTSQAFLDRLCLTFTTRVEAPGTSRWETLPLARRRPMYMPCPVLQIVPVHLR